MNSVGKWFKHMNFSAAQMQRVHHAMGCSAHAFRQRLSTNFEFPYNGDPFHHTVSNTLKLDPVASATLRTCIDRSVFRYRLNMANYDEQLRPAACHLLRNMHLLEESDMEQILVIMRKRLRESA